MHYKYIPSFLPRQKKNILYPINFYLNIQSWGKSHLADADKVITGNKTKYKMPYDMPTLMDVQATARWDLLQISSSFKVANGLIMEVKHPNYKRLHYFPDIAHLSNEASLGNSRWT